MASSNNSNYNDNYSMDDYSMDDESDPSFYALLPPESSDDKKEYAPSEIEMDLENLDDNDNLTQLQLLNLEIQHIMEHGVQPNSQWYYERFLKIHHYSELDWNSFMESFKNKNEFIVESSFKIMSLLQSIKEEWSCSPIFSLEKYYEVINEIYTIWNYFSENYMGDEEDQDVVDLIIGLKHL
jgi:hypothetical protein